MVIFTQLPTRKSAQLGRLLVQDADLEPAHDIVVRELLSRVRLEFEKDDEKMASHLLHYQDIVVQESQYQELRVQFELPYETTEADEEQCRPNRRVYPPTPARPSMETLAKLMDVSYTDWSQPSYEDTSADSKLAEWLASFAQDQRSSSLEDSIGKLMRKPSNTPEASTRKTSLFTNIQPAFGSPGQTPWRPQNRAGSQNSSSGTRRRAVSDPVSPWYNQTSSSASSTSPSPVRHVRLQLSPIHIPDTVNAHRGSMQSTCSDEDKGVQAPVIPPFSFEVQAKALATEDISNHPSPMTPSDAVYQTPMQLDPSSPFVTQSPALEQFLSFSNNLDEFKPNMIQDLSFALGNALPDLSSVHAFNLSLQHASKSPFLIRTWKRMLGELTGRFPLNLDQSEKEVEPITQQSQSISGVSESGNTTQGSCLPNEISTSSAAEFSAVFKDSSETQKMSVDSRVTPTFNLRISKTHADILLDREYAAYIRFSIEAKQEEVRMLNDLIAQRKKTIERMENVLKARALEALKND